jgi:iron complex outermembrane receptor protein
MNRSGTLRRAICLIPMLSACAGTIEAQTQSRDLTEVSLEDLMNIEVTPVSKSERRLISAPAAIFVITQEDVRRSGLSSLPEILRMAPGLDVAQIDGNKWAVSSRGFNAQFSTKLLVLVDGRPVYNPSNSGVYWEELPAMTEDIDRIEIIRGPGATLWGANAVNGVINIITKPSADTQGGLLSIRAGSDDHTVNSVRYGGRAGKLGAYRVYGTYFRRADLIGLGSRDDKDRDWITIRAGFRADLTLSDRDSLMVEGDLFRETSGLTAKTPSLLPPYSVLFSAQETTSAGSILALWNHRKSASSLFTVRAYADRELKDQERLLDEHRTNLDLDFQHTWKFSDRHEIVWGAGIRHNGTSFRNSPTVSFLPATPSQQLYSAFAQDEIRLIPDRFSIVLGSKIEHNIFTGVEVQPSVRFLWIPAIRSALWAAVSRAVRTPSYFDGGSDLSLAAFPVSGELPGNLRLFGSSSLSAETLRAHEAGYRRQIGKWLSLDWTAFYNVYGKLISYEPRPSYISGDPQPPHLVIPLVADNRMHGESQGAEATATWSPVPRWRVRAGYSWLSLQLHLNPSSGDTTHEAQEGQSPRHQLQIRSELDVAKQIQFDAAMYSVSALPALNVPAYTRVDARMGWRPSPRFELSTGGRNLQEGKHLEYVSEGPFAPSRIGRGFYARGMWSF